MTAPFNLRLLVIDDEETMRSIISHVAVASRCDVVSVDSRDDAIRALETYAFDVVICDWTLGVDDGNILVRKIRTEYPNPYTILISGYPKGPPHLEAHEFLYKMDSKFVVKLREFIQRGFDRRAG